MKSILNYVVVFCLLLAAWLYFKEIRSDGSPLNWIHIWLGPKTLMLPRELVCVLLVIMAVVLMFCIRPWFLSFGFGDSVMTPLKKPTAIWVKYDWFGRDKNDNSQEKED